MDGKYMVNEKYSFKLSNYARNILSFEKKEKAKYYVVIFPVYIGQDTFQLFQGDLLNLLYLLSMFY